MNFSLPKLWRKRNKPTSCHSRWRKTLQKRFTLGKIIEARPKQPFMTVEYYEPKTEEDRQAIEHMNRMVWLSGVAVGPMMFTNPGKLLSQVQ
jgi:hypothetical protein